MSSKPLRGTVRWSPQQRYIASSATNALLLTSLTVFLSNLLSPAHGNPLHPFSSSLSLGRNLRHLPCVVRSSGAEGICMFAIDCFKANGTHLGVCIDKIFFGSCCQVHDDSLLFNHEITDNSIDQNHSSGMLYQHFPSVMDNSNRKPPLTETRLPTVTMPKNVTRYELVSTSSTTTHRTTVNRRNSTTTLVTTTTKPVLKDEIPTSTEYQEFSTFQYVQSSKNPDHSTTEANRPTAIKPVDKNTSRKPPVRNSTKPYRTRRPTPNRNGTRRPIVQTTTPKVTITTLPEVKVDSTSRVSVTRRPTTTTESTSSATNASTASSTTVRRTTISSRKPTTTSPVEEIPVAINAEKPAVSIAPLTRPTIKRRPTTQTTIAEPETTMAPRPRPVPTSAIVTVAATSLDHLIEDLVTTTILHTSSPESTTQANVTITVPVTTIRVTETDKPTSTVASSTRRSTTTTKPTTTTTTPVSTTSTSTTTVTRKPTTTSTTLSSRRPTTTSATTTTTTTRKPTTSTTNTTTKKPTSTTTTTTRQPTTTSTATTTRKPTTTTTGTTTKSTTPTTAKITTTTTPKTTTVARITPPAEVDYRPETSQTHHQLDETTAGFGLVTWTSIVDNGVNDRLQAEQATSSSIPEISVEISGPTSPSSEESYTTQTATAELSTVEYVTDITVEESGSVEEGSGSEEESGEEEEEASYSSESYESTSELIQSSTPEPTEQDKFINTTTVTAGSGIAVTTPESTTMITLTTLNITGSMQSIASMFNISSSTGMPVRFPEGNTTTGATNATTPDSITMSPDFITTSTVPSLEGIDYRAVCGKRMFPEPRIVGGTKAAFGRWPWQISLRQWRTSTYLHKCGAALLNENWAITAAHCVDNVPPSDLLLRLGEYDLALEEEPYGYQERRVQIVASHPQFDPRTFEYDLALLRFYEPVQFQPNIIPVCVPGDDENHIGRTAFVTGWGRLYEDGPLPSVLQEVTVPVIENKICETMYRSAGYIEHIPHIFICAGWKKGGYDSCEGDSGGPMVIQRSDKRFQLAGVISWGIGCAEPNQPGVYTRISEFRDWINQILQF
ncbi:serine proteinase stubble isoform X3 [Toxorhynchites rutilus septentrionalis]|uniref:serine proteinase stubble isoform X3 n=1 Tax=Toxorhynchites rutilus septentrionalis TaxID=329112 RepID=UPI00247A9DE8|nr:serine proteinase stubble isoform X3 [Toxorhynchites rutilus septentrionalis]